MAERGRDLPTGSVRVNGSTPTIDTASRTPGGLRIDVNAWIGSYPYRRIAGGSPEFLLDEMRRNAIDRAWVSHLAAVFWRDPTEGNAELYRVAEQHSQLAPVPAVHPGLANWEAVLTEARERGAPAVRVDPLFYGISPADPAVVAVLRRAGQLGLPVMLAVRLEDGRQRHPNDGAGDLTPAHLRGLIRGDSSVRLIVTQADRDCVEQVVFGATPEEADRMLWDVSGIWGPPFDDLALLVGTIGARRFCFGSGLPLRIAEAVVARLDLLDLQPEERFFIERGNVERLQS